MKLVQEILLELNGTRKEFDLIKQSTLNQVLHKGPQ
jgi:hypothetical protein